MFVAGIDAHATYSVIAIVSNTGQLVQQPVPINNTDEERLHKLFEPYRPLEAVVDAVGGRQAERHLGGLKRPVGIHASDCQAASLGHAAKLRAMIGRCDGWMGLRRGR